MSEQFFDYAQQHGLALFPIPFGYKEDQGWKPPHDPAPLISRWSRDWSKDRAQWEAWRSTFNCNFGIYAAASNCIVLDLDVAKDSEIWSKYCAFWASRGIAAPSPQFQSARKGYHVLVKVPDGFDLSTLSQTPLLSNVDTRIQGYIVAPGSYYDGTPNGEASGWYQMIADAPAPHDKPDIFPVLIEVLSSRTKSDAEVDLSLLPPVEEIVARLQHAYDAGPVRQDGGGKWIRDQNAHADNPDTADRARREANGYFANYSEWSPVVGALKSLFGETIKSHIAELMDRGRGHKHMFSSAWGQRPPAADVARASLLRFVKASNDLGFDDGGRFIKAKGEQTMKSMIATANDLGFHSSPPLCPIPLPGAAAPMPRGGSLIGPRGEVLPIDSDDSLALDFADQHGSELRHCDEWGKWLRWDGARWQTDKTSGAYNLVRQHLRRLGGGMHLQDARKILSAKTVAAVERMAKTDPRVATEAAIWDADPWLLNTPGGIVDLRTCVVREPRPENYMTKSTSVAPGGDCPTWRAFLHRALAGDVELISFVQRMLGYSLTGDTREQALFFLYGPGGNGKGVLLNTVAGILADYAKTAPMATFTDSANAGDRHPTDLAGLRGARFVMASETEKGRKWAEAKIKSLTGGDPISARFMGRDFFEYIPTFKLVIAGNHKPRLSTVDEAIRRRMNMVPFTVQIPEQERDRDLPEKLKSEWGGILQWMIEGCLAWQQSGLKPPAAVRAATDEYLSGEDATATWLDDRCEQALDAWAPRTELFASWSGWANNAREPIGTANQFYEAMVSKGFENAGRNGVRGFRGLRLKQFALPPVPER